MTYLAGWVLIAAYWVSAWATLQMPQHRLSTRFRSLALDRALARALYIAFAVLGIAWFVLTGPLQYIVNAVCGAPAQMARGSRDTIWIRKRGTWLADYRTPQDVVMQDKARVKPSKGAIEVGFDRKAVTVTHLIGAVVLWIVSQLIAQATATA